MCKMRVYGPSAHIRELTLPPFAGHRQSWADSRSWRLALGLQNGLFCTRQPGSPNTLRRTQIGGSRTHYLAGPGKLEGMTTAAERLLVPGPEEQQLAGRAGTWTVIATMWPAPGAEPIVTDGLVAERTMIGLYLQETMHPAPGGTGPDFRRIDYLHYDRVEGRWKYVSMDTRLPVSIMPARSFGPAGDRTLRLQFEPLGFVGFGDEVGGTLMQSDMRITTQSPGRELKQQHFIVADGTAREWLAVQYEYRR
jgi:Protein of unknown function (DUF1579)